MDFLKRLKVRFAFFFHKKNKARSCLCMFVCVSVCVKVCLCVFVRLCPCASARVRLCACMFVSLRVCVLRQKTVGLILTSFFSQFQFYLFSIILKSLKNFLLDKFFVPHLFNFLVKYRDRGTWKVLFRQIAAMLLFEVCYPSTLEWF